MAPIMPKPNTAARISFRGPFPPPPDPPFAPPPTGMRLFSQSGHTNSSPSGMVMTSLESALLQPPKLIHFPVRAGIEDSSPPSALSCKLKSGQYTARHSSHCCQMFQAPVIDLD